MIEQESFSLQHIDKQNLPAYIDEWTETAKRLYESSVAESTKGSYKSGLGCFIKFCAKTGMSPVPSALKTIGLYIAYLRNAGRKYSTVQHKMSAIAYLHEKAGYQSPTHHTSIKQILAGYLREVGNKQSQANELSMSMLEDYTMLIDCGTKKGLRDFTLLITGYAAALRRAEIAALKVKHIKFTDTGCIIHLPGSKGDQEGKGANIFIANGRFSHFCPPTALKNWIEASGVTDNLFVSIVKGDTLKPAGIADTTVGRIVKKYLGTEYSAHSLRVGPAVELYKKGVRVELIQKFLRHKTSKMTYRYIEQALQEKEGLTTKLGF